MPYYDYLCPKCNETFEKQVPAHLRDAVCHVPCGTPAMRIWLRAPGIHFKGGGWSSEDKFLREHDGKVKAIRWDEKAQNEIEYHRNMQRAFDNARDPTPKEAEEADRIAFSAR